MSLWEKLIQNDWFIGISCSLIAALIGLAASRAIGYIRHRKRILDADQFVTNQLRAYLVNGGIPPDNILIALKRSSARKFNVKEEELLSLTDYMEDVISGIIGNVYLSIDDQNRYLKIINQYIADHKHKAENTSTKPHHPLSKKKHSDSIDKGFNFNSSVFEVISITIFTIIPAVLFLLFTEIKPLLESLSKTNWDKYPYMLMTLIMMSYIFFTFNSGRKNR